MPATFAACEVYDQTLVSSSAHGHKAEDAKTMIVDGGAAAFDASQRNDAGEQRTPVVRRNAAADGGKSQPATRTSSDPATRTTASESTDDSGTDNVPQQPDRPRRPAADGGESSLDACAAEAGACGKGWLRRITLDGAQVSETLTGFPVLLRITDPHLQTHAANGGELYFTADDMHTLLDFEVESFSPTAELVAWVRVPMLTAGSDTTLYLGYGDGRSGRAKPTGVWADYEHVWHLAEDPSAGLEAIKDSTQHAHGTPHGAMSADAVISGVAGNALLFDGVDDEISFVNDLWGSGPSTFSGWVKQHGSPGQYGTSMISLGGDSSNDHTARFLLSHADDGKVKCGFYGDDDLTTAVLPLGEWKYVSWTWDGRASSVYVDAVRVLGPVNHSQVATAGIAGKIGNTTFKFSYFMDGQLDELHVSAAARSSAWIATEYANQRPGSSFIKAIGAPQPASEH